MKLALHGLLLQVIASIVHFQHGFRLCSAGEPGYLDFDNLPETNFSCQGKVIGGYYADVEAGCQMFHVCTIGQKDEIMDIKFLCLNGTVFDQETRVCERVDEVDCSKSERFYNLNLELYGNNAVTFSLHESDDSDEPSELIEDHQSQRTTSARPSTTSSTTTTTPRPSISSTTSTSGSYQHPNGYPQHFQPQPPFPSVQTSQSKSLYDDKNGGYHHQYIYHTGDHRNNNVDISNDGNNHNNGNNNNNPNNNNNNNQATSYQLFTNQGVSSTTGPPQIHQIRYSSTPATQIQIHNDHQSTVSPIFHATSSTIQTLLNSNANSPALINPIFHSHGISSTTEQFAVHNNNPRETTDYRDNGDGDQRDEDDDRDDRRPLEAIQPTNPGKVSKLTISPIPSQDDSSDRSGQQVKGSQISSQQQQQRQQQQQQQQQQRITTSFLPTLASNGNGQPARSFYPTPRTSTKSQSSTTHITQHIHLPPPPPIPQLKPHQVTINLSPPDIQRIVQNPSPLLPSQSRVIVTAKASVSDESGRPLNSTQLVTLPLPTIPASYDDYKEGDESFDPFYRDVPKIRNHRRVGGRFRWPNRDSRDKRSIRIKRDIEIVDKIEDPKTPQNSDTAVDEESQKKYEKVDIVDEKGSESLKTDTDTSDPADLKVMSSANIHAEEKADEKSVIETKDIDAEEYVNSKTTDSKSVINTKETDAEEIVSLVDSENAKSKADIIDTKETDAEEYVESKNTKLEATSDETTEKLEAEPVKIETKSVTDTDDADVEKYINASEETFDRKIFDEPESRTSKEVDTRAVAQQDSKYSKDRTNRLEKDYKNSKDQHTNVFENSKRVHNDESSRFSFALPEVHDSVKPEEKDLTDKINPETQDPEDEIEDEKDEGKDINDDSEIYEEDEPRVEHDDYYDSETDSSTVKSETKNFDYPKKSRNKISPSSRNNKSFSSKKLEDAIIDEKISRRKDKSEKFRDEYEDINEDEDYDSIDDATTQTNERTDSLEIADDYGDSQPMNDDVADSREVQDDDVEDENLSMTPDYTTEETSSEMNDEEYVGSTEKVETPKDAVVVPRNKDSARHISDDKGLSEGVLKFTDEIPRTDEPGEMEKTESESDIPQDYIDDNYEPESYKEPVESSSTPAALITDKGEKTDSSILRAEDDNVTEENLTTVKSDTELDNIEENQNDQALMKKKYKEEAKVALEKSVETPLEPEQLASTPTSTSTTSTTTTKATTTTTTTTTTTARPTPPKLFKPFTLRKSYVYVPPTTTPVPVIIKPRLPLLNPKPAKPPKSYNDLAPKPVIRKSPLLARKVLTTIRTSTTPRKETEIPEISTEIPVDETSTLKEETSSTTSTTEISTTEESSSHTTTTQRNSIDDEKLNINENDVPTSTPKIFPLIPTFPPYPLLRTIEATAITEKYYNNEPAVSLNDRVSTTNKPEPESNNVPSIHEPATLNPTGETIISLLPEPIIREGVHSAKKSDHQKLSVLPIETTSDSPAFENNAVTTDKSELEIQAPTTTATATTEATTERFEVTTILEETVINHSSTLASIRPVNRRPGAIKRTAFFNCLERDMYRFYSDDRDCRLFHYCSPGFTSRQVLDFRFVCEQGTAFDEESQSCIHDVKNPKCRKKVW